MSNDPFTNNALQPTTTNVTSHPSAHLRNQTSQTSLRSGAGSAASIRTRQTRELFTLPSTRRAPGRALRRVENEILADSDTEHDPVAAQSHRGLRRVRALPAGSRSGKLKQKQNEEIEIVFRQPDGNFIREIPELSETLKEHLETMEMVEDDEIRGKDEDYAAIARQYFTSGASLGGTRSRKHAEEYEEMKQSMMLHLRMQVMQKLEDERWRFEATPT